MSGSTCMMCGISILQQRSTRQTCSARCRKAYSRYLNGESTKATIPQIDPDTGKPKPASAELVECRDCGITQGAERKTCQTCGGKFLNALIPGAC